jgi:hypothetical protein
MRIVALPIDFKASPDGPVPSDDAIYSLAMEFCSRELAEEIDFRDYRKVWVSVQLNEDGQPVKVTGIQCLNQVVDLPISRYTDSKSAKILSERVDSFCADQGLRGCSVFVYISSTDKPEQRCRNYMKWLSIWKAKPADRFVVRVR